MLGLTLLQMAELIGATYEQAHKYEKGINRIAAGRLYRIARAMGVEVSYFFEGLSDEDQAFKPPPQQGMLLDLVRNFLTITDQNRQREACELVRALAANENVEKGANSARAPVKFILKLMMSGPSMRKRRQRYSAWKTKTPSRSLHRGQRRSIPGT